MRAELPAISVGELAKTYGTVVAVDGIDFSVARGSIVGLLGGNGAGKTTTIAMVMGLVLPSRGTARVLGVDMARERHKVLHRINFESPYVEMPKRLTVRQNLKVFGMLYDVRDIAGQIDTLASELDLKELLDRHTGSLSSGQKTRVALAKALINQPDVLLLDAVLEIGNFVERAEYLEVLPHGQPLRHLDIGALEVHPVQHLVALPRHLGAEHARGS